MRPNSHAVSHSAAFNNTLGNFEYQHWQANFKAYQATANQLKQTARRTSQSAPQRLHPITALYFWATLATPQFLGAKSVDDRASDHFSLAVGSARNRSRTDRQYAGMPTAAASVKRVRRDVGLQSFVQSERVDSRSGRHRAFPMYANEKIDFLRKHASGADNDSQTRMSAALDHGETLLLDELLPPWEATLATLKTSDDTHAIIKSSNAQVVALLKEKKQIIQDDTAISLRVLLEQSINFLTQSEHAHAMLAHQLLKSSGNYGAHTEEVLSLAMQKKKIRDWIALNLFGQSLEDLIEQEILHNDRSSHLTSFDLHRRILTHAFHSGAVTDKFKPWILMHVLVEEIPTLGFSETHPAATDPDCERLASMRVNSMEWGQIHAGLRYSQLLGLAIDLDIREAAELGKYMLLQLEEGVAQSVWWELFRLPAIIRFAQENPEAMINTHGALKAAVEADALLAYAAAHEAFTNEYFPMMHFKTLMLGYMTRPQLAKEIINRQCRGLDVSAYLSQPRHGCSTEKFDAQQDAQQDVKQDVRQVVRQRSPSGMLPFNPLLPNSVALPDINQLFQEQIDAIATPYEVIDRAILLTAWNTLAIDDINYINHAEVRRVEAYFTAFDPARYAPFAGDQHLIARLTHLPIKGVEFISARCDGQAERIYVLHQKGLAYEMERVDTTRENYYLYFAEYLHFADDPNYKLQITRLQDVLKTPDQTLLALSMRMSEKHRADFAQELHDYGYEKTTAEKIIEVLLSFVPFYTCIDAVMGGETQEAILPCTIDAISLIPLIGTLSKLSLRLGHIVSAGSIMAIRDVAIEVQLRNTLQAALHKGAQGFARYALLPTAEVLNKKVAKTVAVTALRAIDPGVELVASIGAIPIKQATRLLRSMDQSTNSLRYVLERFDSLLEKLQSPFNAGEAILARRTDIGSNVPVLRLGGDLYHGQPVYVQINEVTGEPFGRKYKLLDDQTLAPVPLDHACHLQNILEQGLAGRGAVKQAVRWAHGEINARTLRQLQDELIGGGNLSDAAKRLTIPLVNLRTYISDSGQLTPLGWQTIDMGEAGSSRDPTKNLSPYPRPQEMMQPVPAYGLSPLFRHAFSAISATTLARPVDLLSTSLRQIQPDQAVKSSFHHTENGIVANNGDEYLYDLDLNVFIEKAVPDTGMTYIADPANDGLISMPIAEAQELSTAISYDQRTAVIKALGIDLDISVILLRQPVVAAQRRPIPKRISYIWVGNRAMDDELIETLHQNCQIANRHGYKVYFYLSSAARNVNYEAIKNSMCGSANCLNIAFSTNEIKILEETSFYQQFAVSKNFQQYRDAIDGNGGIATNFASAVDILRLAVLKAKGGIYMDVDDALMPHFGALDFTTDDNGFLLAERLSSDALDMDHEFGTSFFGAQAGNTVIDDILEEIHRRYALPQHRNFYKEARPVSRTGVKFRDYTRTLSQLTGPAVFNSVLRQKFPHIKEFQELGKLSAIVHRPATSQMMIKLSEKMPDASEITPLADCSRIGNLHSWEFHG